MFLNTIPSAEVLLQPQRLAVLHHLKNKGGVSSFVEMHKAIGADPTKQAIDCHCRKLERAGFIERHLANHRMELRLTQAGRNAMATLAMEVAA